MLLVEKGGLGEECYCLPMMDVKGLNATARRGRVPMLILLTMGEKYVANISRFGEQWCGQWSCTMVFVWHLWGSVLSCTVVGGDIGEELCAALWCLLGTIWSSWGLLCVLHSSIWLVQLGLIPPLCNLALL